MARRRNSPARRSNQALSASIVVTDDDRRDHQSVDIPPPCSRTRQSELATSASLRIAGKGIQGRVGYMPSVRRIAAWKQERGRSFISAEAPTKFPLIS